MYDDSDDNDQEKMQGLQHRKAAVLQQNPLQSYKKSINGVFVYFISSGMYVEEKKKNLFLVCQWDWNVFAVLLNGIVSGD